MTPSGTLYPYELCGNTLVIRPHGDSIGFALQQLRIEIHEVRKLAQTDRVRHLLVDLSDERYFGSMVLGDITEFGNIVRKRGGRTGLCGASPELLTVLTITKMDNEWEFYPDIETGLKDVASIPWMQHIRRYRAPLVGIAAGLLVGMLIAFWPRPDHGREYASRVLLLWKDFEREHALVGEEEATWMNRRVAPKLQPIVDDLQATSKHRELSPLERSMLYATKAWVQSSEKEGAESKTLLSIARLNLENAQKLMTLPPDSPLAADLVDHVIPVQVPPDNVNNAMKPAEDKAREAINSTSAADRN
jgi:anti-anti-sigma factor